MNDCLNFNMKILSMEKSFIGAVDRNDDSNLNMVNQYSIEIFSENELLNNKLEKELQHVQEQQQVVIQEPLFNESELKLQVNEVYKCKYALFDDVNEFYVHLIDNDVYLNELDVYLNDLTQNLDGLLSKYSSLPVKNEIVLAKF